MEDNVFAPSAVQRAILGLLDGGYTDRAIAGRLRVSERTVRGHIRALMAAAGKLGRFALGAEAARRGWLDGDHLAAISARTTPRLPTEEDCPVARAAPTG